jgi:hypothetical protein
MIGSTVNVEIKISRAYLSCWRRQDGVVSGKTSQIGNQSTALQIIVAVTLVLGAGAFSR